LIGKFPLLAGK